jgi:uncharacterized membrane protein YdjX (TVP38/TMEM64 family)
VTAAPNAPDLEAGPPRSLVRRLAPLIALAAILVLFFALGLNRYVSFAALHDHRAAVTGFVADHGALAALLYVAVYIVVVAASLPGGAVLSIAGGFLFGTALGSVCVVIGATVGASLLFLAARTAIGDSLKRRLGARGERLVADLADNAFNYLLVLRLVPLFPFFLVNLVPAFAGIPLRTYVLATFLGIIPGSVVYVSVGDGLGALLERGETPDLSIIFSTRILGPLIGLAVLALIPVVYRRIKRPRPS